MGQFKPLTQDEFVGYWIPAFLDEIDSLEQLDPHDDLRDKDEEFYFEWGDWLWRHLNELHETHQQMSPGSLKNSLEILEQSLSELAYELGEIIEHNMCVLNFQDQVRAIADELTDFYNQVEEELSLAWNELEEEYPDEGVREEVINEEYPLGAIEHLSGQIEWFDLSNGLASLRGLYADCHWAAYNARLEWATTRIRTWIERYETYPAELQALDFRSLEAPLRQMRTLVSAFTWEPDI